MFSRWQVTIKTRVCLGIETPLIMIGLVLAFGWMLSSAPLSLASDSTTARALASAGPSSASPQQTYEGMITDTRCGAKHSVSIGKTASDCTRICVHSGEQFALIDGDQVYVLRGESSALKLVAGQRARVAGILNGRTIFVTAVRQPGS